MKKINYIVIIGALITVLFTGCKCLSFKSDKKISERFSKSFVKIYYYLKFSDGEMPKIAEKESWDIESKIPVEVSGFLVEDNKVLSCDLKIDKKFIDKIEIVFKNEKRSANISGYALDKNAIELTLKKSFKYAKPLNFNGNPKVMAYKTWYYENDGLWRIKTLPISQNNPTYIPSLNANYIKSESNSIILDDKYNPIIITIRDEFSANPEWLQSPKNWEFINTEQFDEKLKKIEEQSKTICKVFLKFRKKEKRAGYDRWSIDDDKIITELDAHGIIYDTNKVLVLGSLDNEETARLEEINVSITGYDKILQGKFKVSLKKIGGFLIELPEKLEKGYVTKFSKENIKSYNNEPIFTVDVKLSKDKTKYTALNSWITAYEQGIDNCFKVDIKRKTDNTFLFNKRNELIAMPINIRSIKSRNNWYTTDKKYELLPVSYLLPYFMEETAQYIDVANVPLSENSEQQMGWLGIELQPLTEKFAKVYGVSNIDDYDEYGGLVTFVYKNSDADKQNIKIGDMLLNIYPNATEQKIKIELKKKDIFFHWDDLDDIYESDYESLPIPWDPICNNFNKSLKSIGWGNKFRIELFRKGKIISKEFIVKKAPLHFEISEKYKRKSLGVTIKNITFEVKRYYKRKDSDLGVLITKIELGSKVSVAGIKPYELITHIDGKKINSINDFKLNIKDKTEIEVTVVKLGVSRIVKIILD